MGALLSKDHFDPTNDLVDLKGKVVIVTGGNRGIGYGTVKHFAKAGAKVYIAARNEKAALDAIKSLKSELGNGEVEWLKYDQSDPREAKKSAEAFLKLESRLDILVLNAAMTSLSRAYELTPDGVSTTVIVNHVSPVAFTNALLPLMTETARLPNTDVRIVNVSSVAMRAVPTAGLSFKQIEDLNMEFKGHSNILYRYGHSKLLGVMWTRSLQKHLDESNPPVPITAIVIHPGTVKTFIDRPDVPLSWRLYSRAFGVDIDRGAYNSMFAAASKQVAQERERYKGQYIEPVGKIITPPEAATDKGNVEDLWRTTEDFLRKLGIQ